MKSLWMALALVGVLLGACGGGSGDGAESEGGTPETSGSALTATTEVTEPTTQITEPATEADGSGSGFCATMRTEQAREIDVFDPASLEEQFNEALDVLKGLRDSVPAQLREDFDVYVEYTEQVVELWESYDYNIVIVPEDQFAALRTPEVDEASASLSGYCSLEDLISGAGEDDEAPTLDAGDFPSDLVPPGAGPVTQTSPGT